MNVSESQEIETFRKKRMLLTPRWAGKVSSCLAHTAYKNAPESTNGHWGGMGVYILCQK
jgi:hypothetical protein